MVARLLLAALAALALLVGCGGDENGESARPRGVTLALDFAPNPVHTGIYAALGSGADLRHGVALTVRSPSASTDSLKLLASGRADVAVVDIHDLGLARERGEDVVGVGALVERPLAAVLTEDGVRRPRELEGRRAGVTGLPSDEAVLRAVVEHDGGDFDRVRRTTIGFSAVPSLIAGKVAAATAFWNAEGVTLRRRGFAAREFRVDRYGAPPYPELVLAVRRRTLENERELVADLLSALAEGNTRALRDPGPALRRIGRLSGARPGLLRAEYDAVRPVLSPTLALDRRTLEAWARFDRRFGILRRPLDVGSAFELGLARGG